LVTVKKLEIFIDGASKGNPGPSGIGIVVCDGSNVIRNISVFIGDSTNNIAEYTALIYGLQECLIIRADSVKINSDSQLLCRQLNGQYKVKDPGIKRLYDQAMHLFTGFKEVVIVNIPRTENKGADKLANEAVKSQDKVDLFNL